VKTGCIPILARDTGVSGLLLLVKLPDDFGKSAGAPWAEVVAGGAVDVM
jgi:hypothetical protein